MTADGAMHERVVALEEEVEDLRAQVKKLGEKMALLADAVLPRDPEEEVGLP